MKLAQTPLLLTLLQFIPLSLAQTDCTQSTALKYTTADDPCSTAAIARDSTGCVAEYCQNGGTSKSLNACFCLAGVGENCGSVGSRDLVVESLEKRAGFTCSSSETCYINPADGGLFCLDVSTGDYVGESGNVDTGAYTAASGGGTTSVASTSTRTSANSGAAATSSVRSVESAVSTRSTSTLSSSGSRTGTTRSTATTTGTSTSASVASATSATSSANGRQIRAGATLGALGVVVGFLL